MNIKQVDFHGLKLEDALAEVDQIVGDHRLAGRAVLFRFVTGNGTMKAKILDHLRNYGLEANEELGNPGALVALIE